MHNESGLEVIDTSLKKLTQGATSFDFETSPKESSLTNKTLRQDMASLKQTKNFKRIIDVYPLVGTGGGGKTKKTKVITNKKVILRQESQFHQKINFAQ